MYDQLRVVIRGVQPELECGRFPIKRTIGDVVDVEADVFADGHDELTVVLEYHHEHDPHWSEIAMEPVGNDHWRGRFTVHDLGQYVYRLHAWVDPFATWYRDLVKRIEANQDVAMDLAIGSALLKSAADRAPEGDANILNRATQNLSLQTLNADIRKTASRYADRASGTVYRDLRVVVDRERARFSTWYEMFPRSHGIPPGQHGTFKDCERVLPELAAMGFDVLYFPPVHPIGRKHRKGRNNSLRAGADDPGSPWAIGAAEGGHKSTHPALGTLADFRHLVEAAKEYGIEIALDIAYQVSPDHPYIQEHPEWFRRRPDGTMQYAENPPKKYEDIYPFDFDTQHRQSLWNELKSIIEFWIEQGVRIFRVDNPHTKPFAFWAWMIDDLKKTHPDLILLSEAFTRPNVMYWLAKIGFTQSYTYFTWRNTKEELTAYFTELTKTSIREFFRPNLWPNTPDILNEYLQHAGKPAFVTRLVLAATLSGNYGIYGPAYELYENVPKGDGTEEYIHSEKYEIKQRNLNDEGSLRHFIGRVNAIRRENPSLQRMDELLFHHVDNDRIICYSKRNIITVVNLDWRHTQAGFVDLDLYRLGIDNRKPYRLIDLLSGVHFTWQGSRNYVELRPGEVPAHILRVGT